MLNTTNAAKSDRALKNATPNQLLRIARMIKEIDSSTRNELSFRRLAGGTIAVTEFDRTDRVKASVRLYTDGDVSDPILTAF